MKKHVGSIILAIAILYFAIDGYYDKKHLDSQGVFVRGIIDSAYKGAHGSRYLIYSFIFAGRRIEGEALLRDFQECNIGDSATIIFDPDDPEDNRMQGP